MSDYGSVHFVGNDKGWFSHVFRRHTRIRLLNKKSFHLATVEIPLYMRDENVEKAGNIIASTYNIENGAVVESQLDKKDIFEDRRDKNHMEMRFTLPAVKEGSIIEYSYEVTSVYNYQLSWEFQSVNYPCAYSELRPYLASILSISRWSKGSGSDRNVSPSSMMAGCHLQAIDVEPNQMR